MRILCWDVIPKTTSSSIYLSLYVCGCVGVYVGLLILGEVNVRNKMSVLFFRKKLRARLCFSLAEVRSPNEINIVDLQKNLQNLYEYNLLLRDKLIAACSNVNVLANKEPPSTVQCHE